MNIIGHLILVGLISMLAFRFVAMGEKISCLHQRYRYQFYKASFEFLNAKPNYGSLPQLCLKDWPIKRKRQNPLKLNLRLRFYFQPLLEGPPRKGQKWIKKI